MDNIERIAYWSWVDEVLGSDHMDDPHFQTHIFMANSGTVNIYGEWNHWVEHWGRVRMKGEREAAKE